MRLTYVKALNQGLFQAMEKDFRVVVIGQGVTSPWYVGGTCEGLSNAFGPWRVMDTPVSENAVTGAAVGMALAGLRPVCVFPRMDFMLYAMDPIINQAAKWSYMFGGRACCPVVFWAIINRGGCQGAQHSQDFTWLFARIPGLKVVSPQTPSEAKGLLYGAILDDNPVVFVDDRARYGREGEVNPELYFLPVDDYRIRFEEGPDCPAPCAESLEGEYFKRIHEPRRR